MAAAGTFLASLPAEIIGRRRQIMDHPGERSSHTVAVPRTGGIAIMFGMLLATVLFGSFTVPLVLGLGSVAIIAAVSLLDDVVTIPSVPRLIVHLAVTCAVILLAGLELTDIELPYVSLHLGRWGGLVLAALFVAGFVNFFNFMDGINGIAVAQGAVGGGALAGLLLLGGGQNSVVIALALAGACIGFAPHNFPKARLFMGDSGSTILGYVLAVLTLVGAKRTGYPWPAFVLPLGVFLYDATFTLFKRAGRCENVIKPHREHHYQLLIRSGWTHTRTTLLQAALMLLCGVGAFVYAFGGQATRLATLVGLLAAGGCYSALVHRYFATHRLDLQAGSPPPENDTDQAT